MIVLLGGLGFLGSHISRVLVESGHQIRVFDRLNTFPSHIQNLKVEHISGDATDPDTILNVIKDAHTVIHLIHSTVPASSMRDPAADVIQNVAASVRWLQRLNETDVKRLIFISSGGTVYGVAQSTPITEDHPTNPISSYGITKLTLEKYVAMYARDIDYQILRPSNVYGVGQKLTVAQGVIGVMINRALQGEPFELWGDGQTIRDYLYVEDMAQAVKHLLVYKGDDHIFNVGAGVGHSLLDVIDTVRSVLDCDFEIVQKPAGGFSVPVNILDSSRLQSATGWQSTTTFEDGIAKTVEWLRD